MPEVPHHERDPDSERSVGETPEGAPPEASDDASRPDPSKPTTDESTAPAPRDSAGEQPTAQPDVSAGEQPTAQLDASAGEQPTAQLDASAGEQPTWQPDVSAEPPAPPAAPAGEGWQRDAVAASADEDRGAHPAYLPPPSWPQLPAGASAEARYGAAAAPPAEGRAGGRPFARGLREVAETIILAILIFLLVRALVQNFQVEGSSMEPTFESGWYLLVNKALYFEINLETVDKFLPFIDPGDDPTRYLFRGPHRGDVIVFEPPGQQGRDFIKRIIAEPGEVIEVRDGTVFIDGGPLAENYEAERPRQNFGPVRIPEGCYFVLGDNRNNSSDSRSFGAVPKENIVGQAWLTYWPFSAFGLVNNVSAQPEEGASPPPKELVATSASQADAPLAECRR